MKVSKEFIDGLEKTLPPFFFRQDAETVTLGFIKPSYLAFLACKGGGPKCQRVNGKMAYMKKDFIDWISTRRTHYDRFDYEPAKFGYKSARPAGATFGFEPRVEGA